MNMLLLVALASAGKYGITRPAAPAAPAEAGCNKLLAMSDKGLSVCGGTATFSYPAKPITDLLGPWDRSWKPEGEGVNVRKYVYDSLGLTVREPSDGPTDDQAVMLELTCDDSNRRGPFADKPFAGQVSVATPKGSPLVVACSTMESDFVGLLQASGLEFSKTDWQSYRIPLGEVEVAVGFPLDFQRPSPESDAAVSYIELRPKKD